MVPIKRKMCVMCKGSLVDLHRFEDFPIYMGVADLSIEHDQHCDMIFSKCKSCGMVQLRNLIPLEILYAKGHAAVIGPTWKKHHDEFYEFIKDSVYGNIVEIGGANLMLSKKLADLEQINKITVFDNNILQYQDDKKINDKIVLREEFFNPDKLSENVDVIIHTHLIEHLYNPLEEIYEMSKLLKNGSQMMFAFPLADEMLKSNFTNAMNFEHSYFIDMSIAEAILNFSNFEITKTKNFSPYAAFVIATKKEGIKQKASLKNLNHEQIFEGFYQHHYNDVQRIIKELENNKEETFIFGAHIFTQFLFGFGLKEECFLNVLDNDPAKIGNRLYGTKLQIKSPKILKDIKNPVVVLKAAMYTDEIKEDILKNINPNTRFIL